MKAGLPTARWVVQRASRAAAWGSALGASSGRYGRWRPVAYGLRARERGWNVLPRCGVPRASAAHLDPGEVVGSFTRPARTAFRSRYRRAAKAEVSASTRPDRSRRSQQCPRRFGHHPPARASERLGGRGLHPQVHLIRHQCVGVHRDLLRPDQLPQMGEQEVELFCRGERALPIIAPGDHVHGAACRRFQTKCGRATTRGARGIPTRSTGRTRSSPNGYGFTADRPRVPAAKNQGHPSGKSTT
jgi:hypothetical protein